MATFGSDASASTSNPLAGSTSFAGGGNPLAGGGNPLAGGGNPLAGGGGNPLAGGGGNPFGGGGNPFAGGGNAPSFNGKWDFNYNWNFANKQSIVSQVGESGGGAGQKPEAVPESVSSVSLVVLGCACLLWSRFKRASHC